MDKTKALAAIAALTHAAEIEAWANARADARKVAT
jgi:hypothetical protein